MESLLKFGIIKVCWVTGIKLDGDANYFKPIVHNLNQEITSRMKDQVECVGEDHSAWLITYLCMILDAIVKVLGIQLYLNTNYLKLIAHDVNQEIDSHMNDEDKHVGKDQVVYLNMTRSFMLTLL